MKKTILILSSTLLIAMTVSQWGSGERFAKADEYYNPHITYYGQGTYYRSPNPFSYLGQGTYYRPPVSFSYLGQGTYYQDQDRLAEEQNLIFQESMSLEQTDRNLNMRIYNELSRYNLKTIAVEVSNGSVTLRGVVDSEYTRHDIKNRVQQMDGVARVNDELRVIALQ